MNRKNKGFTLVEILVVITIITLLVSLLVVLIGSVIDRARCNSFNKVLGTRAEPAHGVSPHSCLRGATETQEPATASGSTLLCLR